MPKRYKIYNYLWGVLLMRVRLENKPKNMQGVSLVLF